MIRTGIEQILASCSSPHRDIVWLSDMNIDLSEASGLENDFLNKMAELGLEWCTTGWTRRGNNNQGTTIDHVFLRNFGMERYSVHCADSGGVSDHELIKMHLFKRDKVSRQKQKVARRCVADWNGFARELAGADVDEILRLDDPDAILERVWEVVREASHKTSTEVVMRRKKVSLKPWMSTGLLRSIKTRDRLWLKVKANPYDANIRARFNKYRNWVREALREAERRYISQSLIDAGDPKTTWRVINELIRGKTQRRVCPPQLICDNADPVKLNHANTFFAETGKRVAEAIGPLDDFVAGQLLNIQTVFRQFQCPTLVGMERIVDGQRGGKSPGADGITNRTLKSNKPFFVPILRHLCERIFITTKFPDRLKEADVVLIHKGGNVEDLENYRPISLLSALNKVIEKCMADQLMAHLNNHGILSERQYGFRRNLGTQHAILDLHCAISEANDNKLIPVVFLADFSKAFDCLPYRRFLQKT